MENDVTIYKAKKSQMSGGVFLIILLFFGFMLPTIISGNPLSQRQIVGQSIFWALAIILTILPLGTRMEVGKDYVKWHVFGIRTSYLRAADIEEIHYTKIIRWAVVGMGNGLAGWAKSSYGHKYFSFSETWFGKEAIMHAKRVLESDLKKPIRLHASPPNSVTLPPSTARPNSISLTTPHGRSV